MKSGNGLAEEGQLQIQAEYLKLGHAFDQRNGKS